ASKRSRGRQACKKAVSSTKPASLRRRLMASSSSESCVVKVEDIPSIMRYGVMSTPALVIDGQVMFSGKTASAAEIAGMLP
ncbi:MAG: thioredoxin family protein, partial [Desulfobacteraceae bacterium]|nr:thioredoxin family protein [Desulfobacteraceae bacterium]